MIAVAVIMVALASLVAFSPLIHRDTRRRWETGKGAGLGSALDAVWRPSVEDANEQWEASARSAGSRAEPRR